jgi:hypothetical protein
LCDERRELPEALTVLVVEVLLLLEDSGGTMLDNDDDNDEAVVEVLLLLLPPPLLLLVSVLLLICVLDDDDDDNDDDDVDEVMAPPAAVVLPLPPARILLRILANCVLPAFSSPKIMTLGRRGSVQSSCTCRRNCSNCGVDMLATSAGMQSNGLWCNSSVASMVHAASV